MPAESRIILYPRAKDSAKIGFGEHETDADEGKRGGGAGDARNGRSEKSGRGERGDKNKRAE